MSGLLRFCYLLVIYVGFRFELLFSSQHSLKFWNSDNAVMGLMADQIYRGEGFPFYYWGQEYFGPLTSWLAPILQIFMDWALPQSDLVKTGFAVHPQTLVLTGALVTFLGFWSLSEYISRHISVFSGLALGTFLSLSASLIFRTSLRPFGQEAIFLCLGLILWSYTWFREHQSSSKRQYVFGLTLAFAYWVHHGSLLILGAIGVLWLLEHLAVIKQWQLMDKILLRYNSLPSNRLLRLGCLTVLILLGIRMIVGLSIDLLGFRLDTSLFGYPVTANNGTRLIRSSGLAALFIYACYHLVYDRDIRSVVQTKIRYFYPLALGFLSLLVPLKAGKLFGLYQGSYSFSPQIARWDQFLRFDILLGKFIPEMLAPNLTSIWSLGTCLGIGTLAFLQLRNSYGSQQQRWFSKIMLALITLNWGILLVTSQYYGRYGLISMIGLLSLAAIQIYSLEGGSKILALALGVSLVIVLYRDALSFKQRLIDLPTPLAEIDKLISQDCQVYFANYWDAYRLEYLSGARLKFIPWESQDRAPQISLARKQQEGTKCWYVNGIALRQEPSKHKL